MTPDQLVASAEALLDLDARGALVPHGIGGHARTIIEGFLALASRSSHTGRAGVTEAMVEAEIADAIALLEGAGYDILAPSAARVPAWKGPAADAFDAVWLALLEKDDRTSPEEYPDMALITRDELREALNAALTVEPEAPTKDEIRNEIARREEAGVDARVPLTGPAKFKGWSDADLRSAIAP